MKRLLSPLPLIIFILVACSSKTPKDIAIKNIAAYMNANLNDPKSYESVRFGEIKNDSSDFRENPEYIKLNEEADSAVDAIKATKSRWLKSYTSYETYLRESAKQSFAAADIQNKLVTWLKNYKAKPVGFWLMHVYRKKNSKGVTVIDSMAFRLDSQYNVKPKSFYKLINED